jgi:hypothetical protein
MLFLLHLQAEQASLSVPREFSDLRAKRNLTTSMHPNGNIAEFLTSAGLAKVIDVS